MLISSKVSNSIIKVAEKKGVNLDSFFEQNTFPMEFLKDPSCWVDAAKIESFLSEINSLYENTIIDGQYPTESLMVEAGHCCSELSSWGVLGSVLKIMKSVEEIFHQPDRFLSYFISPPPPIGKLLNDENNTQFQLPISVEDHPLFSTYLIAALEGLPLFFQEELAQVSWQDSTISIVRSREQKKLLIDEEASDRNMSPEFLRQLVSNLENSQKELEERNRNLLLNKENEVQKFNEVNSQESEKPLKSVLDDLMRLKDYMTRSQQLVTLLVGQNRMDTQVKKAMHKVDWDFIQKEFSKVIDRSTKNIEEVIESKPKKNNQKEKNREKNTEKNGEKKCQKSQGFMQEKLLIAEEIQL